jgi:tRNA G37 N-methylase Trm5
VSGRAPRRRRLLAAALLAPSLATLPRGARAQDWPSHTPYFPTPDRVVERMLALAEVGPNDVLYDLGSGDGRIVIAAAKRGARAYGVDIESGWTRRARRSAEAAGVADRATFETGDAFKTDVSRATVVTLYLPPQLTTDIAPKLQRELKPGTRIVSHEYLLGEWPPRRTETVMGENGRPYPIHLWVVGQ